MCAVALLMVAPAYSVKSTDCQFAPHCHADCRVDTEFVISSPSRVVCATVDALYVICVGRQLHDYARRLVVHTLLWTFVSSQHRFALQIYRIHLLI